MSDRVPNPPGGANHLNAPDPDETTAGVAAARTGDDLPLMDPRVLADLELKVGGPVVAQRFARDYAEMWEDRYRRLADAFKASDRDTALEAVISLKTSAAMIGGLRLARLAEDLEHIIRNGELSDGHQLVAMVADRGIRTVQELQETYIVHDRRP
ncbi:Hpt domain-containing protein [Arthrobacter sp. 92]|uniref:Hpt domain-containing protein n=1 Tax=Arthrobacter sp. 92 TaxID=3418175 RepID=UPI003D01A753